VCERDVLRGLWDVMMEGGCGMVFEFSEPCSILSKNIFNASIQLNPQNSGFLDRRQDAGSLTWPSLAHSWSAGFSP
jgi:hypothetical protein